MARPARARHSDGIWIVDVTGKTVYANKKMAKILRTSRPKMIGDSSLIYAVPELVPEEIHTSQRAPLGPYEESVRLRLLRTGSSAVLVDLKQSPMLSSSGKIIGTIGIVRVISEDPATATGTSNELVSLFASHLLHGSKANASR